MTIIADKVLCLVAIVSIVAYKAIFLLVEVDLYVSILFDLLALSLGLVRLSYRPVNTLDLDLRQSLVLYLVFL